MKTIFITITGVVTREHTISSFKDSLVILVAPMWENGIIVPCYMGLVSSQIYRNQHDITVNFSTFMAIRIPLIHSYSSSIFQSKSYT